MPGIEKHDEEALDNPIAALVERLRWLDDCPFTDGQPFYETAQAEVAYWTEEALAVVEAFGDEDILHAARAVEAGDAESTDASEADLWEGIAEQMAEKAKQRSGFEPLDQ